MEERSLKDKITTSTVTLFVAGILAAFLWLQTGLPVLTKSFDLRGEEWANIGGFFSTLLIMASLRHMSNGNALMRVRTWMVPSVFLIMSGAIFSLHALKPVQTGVFLYAFSQYYLLKSYQEYHAERFIVVSFIFLGAASIFYPPLVYLSVLYLVSMLVQLRAFMPRTILAGIFGLIVPIEFYVVFLFLTGNPNQIFNYFDGIFKIENLVIPKWTLVQMVNLGFVIVPFLIGCIHYAHTNFNDKIRTRMYFYVIILQTAGLLVLLALHPLNYNELLPFIVMECSPVVGHYLVFSRGKVGDIFFILIILLTLAVAGFNIWAISLHYS